MSDYINKRIMTKEQIINHLRYEQQELSEARGSDYSGVKALEEAIKELSSIEINGNLIARQKVLATLDFADKALSDEVRTVENFKALLRECIKVLPSSSENIRCKDCKFLKVCGDDTFTEYMCGNAKSWVVATDLNFGCILAER